MAEVESVQVVTETVEVTETKTITTSSDGTVTETTVVKTVESGDSHGQEEAKPAEAVQAEVKENGGAEPTKEEEAPAATEDGEKTATEEQAAAEVEVQEEKKEEGPPKVILHQFPPATNIPSLSPFCLKLETFLRMNKVPYENVHSYKVGKKGKMPWIEYKGEKVPDSNFIIDYLNKTFEIDMDKNLSKSEKAQSRALKVMLEEQTNFTIAYSRWVDEFNEFKKVLPAHQKGIGFAVTFKMHQRKVRSALDHQGLGRHSREEIYKIAEQDLRSLSDYLGEKPYLMGAEVTTLDASAFGTLANILYSGLETSHSKMVKEEFKNLADYVERLKSEFWADWSEVVLGDKPEHTHIRRRFSFKTGKKKAKEAKKEENSTEEEKPEEGSSEKAGTTEEGEAKAEATGEGEEKAEEEKAEETKPEEKTEEKTEETAQVNGEATESEKAEAAAQ